MAEYVTTHSANALALVAAGYGVGFSTAAHVVACRQADVIVRPLDEDLGGADDLPATSRGRDVGATAPLH